MTNQAFGPAESAAAAALEVAKAEPAARPESTNLTTTTPPISKWPWWATLAVALALLVGLFVFQGLLWDYVRDTDEALEGQDFDQLKSIADNIQTIVVLLVGAIFGVGATQGVAAGAAKAADENKKAAEESNAVAEKNAVVAENNRQRAVRFETATNDLAQAITSYRSIRSVDESGHVTNLAAFKRANAALTFDDSDVQAYDPELDQMAAAAEKILRNRL